MLVLPTVLGFASGAAYELAKAGSELEWWVLGDAISH
jgi:hypothetical protein